MTTHDWSTDVDAEHLAHIRAHAGLYAAGGRRHLILEVLAYANDEAESTGRVGRVLVTTDEAGLISVADDGRGTDTRVDSDGTVIRKPVMATRDVRFFGAPDGPRLPDALPRHGMSAVAALCPVLTHENHRADGAWSQTYRHGVPDKELRQIDAAGPTGTWVTFRPGAGVGGPRSLTEGDLRAFDHLHIDCRVHEC